MASSEPCYPELGVNCFCGLSSVLRQCQKGKPGNVGRFFYTCPKNKDQDPCKYFLWADAPAKATPPPPPAKVQPPPHKKLKRTYAVADLSTTMPITPPEPTTPLSASQKGMLQEWDSRMAMVSSANAQMLIKALEQNTLAMEAMKKMMEVMNQTMNRFINSARSNTSDSTSSDDDSTSSQSLPPLPLCSSSSSSSTPLVVNPSCSQK